MQTGSFHPLGNPFPLQNLFLSQDVIIQTPFYTLQPPVKYTAETEAMKIH